MGFQSTTVPQKYLKDENGNIFSPITSADSVYHNDTSITKIVPQTYKFSTDTLGSILTLFSGSVERPSMIKIYALLSSGTATTTKAIYLRLNNTECSAEHCTDTRFREGNVDKYQRRVTSSADIYCGDIPWENNSTYFETVIVFSTLGNWHTFITHIGCSTSTTNNYSVSTCSGQFQQALSTITKLDIVANQTIYGTGIVQIFP